MKKYTRTSILIYFIFSFLITANGQSVGLNTNSPDPSAILDMGSLPKGLLIPRMTQADRLLISPLNALLVYQTDHPAGFYYYDNLSASWRKMEGYNNKLRDTDGNTQAQVEANTNENIMRVDIGGQEKLTLVKNIVSNYVRFNLVNNQGNIMVGDSTNATAGSSAKQNVAIGHAALKSNISGINNIAFGTSSLSKYNGNDYIGIGYEAGKNAISGDNLNIALGYKSLINGGGDFNVIVGAEASPKTQSGSNIAIGTKAAFNSTSVSSNIILGSESMFNLTNGDNNIGIGYRSNINSQGDLRNVAIGSESGNRGTDYIGFGYRALASNTDDFNYAVGSQSLMNHVSGRNNISFGYNALTNHASGVGNTAIGSSALESNITGRYNIGVGRRALSGELGYFNIGLGNNALSSIGSNTNRNVILGSAAQDNIVPGDGNIVIGYNAAVGPGVSNAVVLGSNAYADSSNTVILGSVAGVNGATETVQVGLGTSKPHSSAIFEINSPNRPFSLPTGSNNLAHAEPEEGLILNYPSSNTLFFYNGTAWEDFNPIDLYQADGATTGQAYVYRNGNIIKGFPNAIQDDHLGGNTISKATIEETENQNKFKLQLHGEDIMSIKDNANGQLIIETGNNAKSILSGIYDITSSSETTLLCSYNKLIYEDGNTIAGDYAFSGTTGNDCVGLGHGVFYNLSTASSDESVAVGNNAGLGMTGSRYTIAGHEVLEQFVENPVRNEVLIIGNTAANNINTVWIDPENATVIGNSAHLNCRNCVVIGKQKDLSTLTNADPEIGIGTTAPQHALHIYGTANASNPHLRLEMNDADPVEIYHRNGINSVQNVYVASPHSNTNSASFKLACTYNGSMLTLLGNGNATITSLVQLSDQRLKKDITPLNNIVNKLAQLHTVRFKWNNHDKDDKHHIGFLAQDMEVVFPELTNRNDEGFLTVNYLGMNAVLWQALKELSEMNEKQSKTLSEQEQKIKALKDRVEQAIAHSKNIVAK